MFNAYTEEKYLLQNYPITGEDAKLLKRACVFYEWHQIIFQMCCDTVFNSCFC